MLTEKVKDSLKKNWGDKANALDCYAEVKFIDPISSWCCYIFAMDKDENVIQCLLYSAAMGAQITELFLPLLVSMYNEQGDNPVIDEEYRRTKVDTLLKRLQNET